MSSPSTHRLEVAVDDVLLVQEFEALHEGVAEALNEGHAEALVVVLLNQLVQVQPG